MVQQGCMRFANCLLAMTLSSQILGCGAPATGEESRLAPELRLEEVHFRVFRDARLVARGTAAGATYRRDSGDYSAEGVEAFLSGDRQGSWSRLTAPRAAGNPGTKDLMASGGVRFERDGETALSDEARYEPGDRLVHGDRPLLLRGRDWVLEGPTWLLDPSGGAMRVRGGARVVAGGGGER